MANDSNQMGAVIVCSPAEQLAAWLTRVCCLWLPAAPFGFQFENECKIGWRTGTT